MREAAFSIDAASAPKFMWERLDWGIVLAGCLGKIGMRVLWWWWWCWGSTLLAFIRVVVWDVGSAGAVEVALDGLFWVMLLAVCLSLVWSGRGWCGMMCLSGRLLVDVESGLCVVFMDHSERKTGHMYILMQFTLSVLRCTMSSCVYYYSVKRGFSTMAAFVVYKFSTLFANKGSSLKRADAHGHPHV
jgi:hypothetical protein